MEGQMSAIAQAPFVCGLCGFFTSHILPYLKHCKTHEVVHNLMTDVCLCMDAHMCLTNDKSETSCQYSCHQCCSAFSTVCRLHDHLTKCTKNGPYIFDTFTKTAFPLSALNDFLTDKGRPTICDIHVRSEAVTEKEVLNRDHDYQKTSAELPKSNAVYSEQETHCGQNEEKTKNKKLETSVTKANNQEHTANKKTRGSRRSDTRKSGVETRMSKRMKTATTCDTFLSEDKGVKVVKYKLSELDIDGNEDQAYVDKNGRKDNEVLFQKKRNERNGAKNKNSRKGNQTTSKLSNQTCKLDTKEPCVFCGIKLPPGRLKKHLATHSSDRPYKCDLCPKTYKYKNHLNVHQKSHNDVLPYCCDQCGQGFVTLCFLKQHFLAMHAEKKPFECSVCGAGFATKFKLSRHSNVHTGKKAMQCDLCGMRFVHKENLTQHVKGVHRQEKRFPCKQCDKKFMTNYQLKCHLMKQHSSLRPYKCPSCNSSYVERKDLRGHMKKHHNLDLDNNSAPDLSTLVDSSALMSDLKSITLSNSVLPDSRPCTVPAVVNKTDTTDDNHVEFVVICSIDSSDNPSGQAETLEDSDGLPYKPYLQAGLP